jgi:hypothetical protein
MHREISSRWLLISDDLKLLQGQQVILRSQVAAQAATSGDGDFTSSNLKEIQEKVSNVLRGLAQADQRLKDLEAAKALLENQDETLEHRVDALQAKEKQLSEQLVATLLLVRDLKSSGSPPPLSAEKHFDLTGDGQESNAAFKARLESVESVLFSLKAETSVLGKIKSFLGIIPNIQSVKDVEAWLTTAFRDPDGGGAPYHEDREKGEYLPEDDIPTFCAFSNVYVVLATCKELEGVVTKTETLKERDLLDKSGLNHPGESTVIYSLKHTIPNLLSKGASNPRQTALRAIKTAADFRPDIQQGASNGSEGCMG